MESIMVYLLCFLVGVGYGWVAFSNDKTAKEIRQWWGR